MKFWFVACVVILLMAAPASLPAAEPLERELIRQAPKIVKHIKEKKYANVGVLKFLVSKGGSRFSDNVGTLNCLLAKRLELALIMANDPREPVGIVENSNAVAQNIMGANHLTRDGRKKLFGGRYPLAWGKQEVTPDAFLTGTVQISRGLGTMTVSLLAFDKNENKLLQVGDDFIVANDPSKLSEIGESFTTRGLFDADPAEADAEKEKSNEARIKASEAKVLAVASEIKEGKSPHPALDSNAPVVLEVFYDNKRIPLEQRDGKAFIREPQEGQKVEFVIRRRGSKERLKAVLKVNGVNTARKQSSPDAYCVGWIQDPEDQSARVRGYQLDADRRENFKVLSAKESKEREIDYGEDVGTISLTVFREAKSKPPIDTSDEGAEVAAVAKAELPAEKPANYNALKVQLLEDANRGLITEGEQEEGKVRKVAFNADPTPVMSVTVVYYRR